MIAKSIIIREVEIADIPQIMPLLNDIWRPYKPADYFRWWIFESLIPVIAVCAVYKDEIIGMFMVFKRKLTNGLNCGVIMGTIITPKWRGKGLLKVLADKATIYFKDIDMVCCLTNLNGKKALEKNLDFRTIGSIETMTLPKFGNTNQQGCICKPITSDIRLDIRNMNSEGPLMFEADERFRRWRIIKHPLYSHQLIKAKSNEYVVTKVFYDKENGIGYGDIVDFELSCLQKDSLANLLNSACSSLEEINVITIQAIPNSLLYNTVVEMGFVESRVKHYFCMKVNGSQKEYLYDSSNWLLKWGDFLR